MRIVSLCPSLTELVFDLGRGDDLVGITKYCVHPADGVARIKCLRSAPARAYRSAFDRAIAATPIRTGEYP